MDLEFNETHIPYPLIRQPLHLLIIYCVAYGIIFIIGLAGNAFVVISVAMNISMRNITNYLITNLAVADLLIIILNVPATLANNLFFEWWLGDVMCRLSVWTGGATVCASVYTLVAVSADRYCAICHTMKYSVISKRRTFLVIIPIWIVSIALFTPTLIYFKEQPYPNTVENSTTTFTICYPQFPSLEDERLYFLLVNIIIAFFIPLVAITVFYVFIYSTFVSRGTLAVDKHAQERESRTKMKITKMMLVVIILFAVSWAPLYAIYVDSYFIEPFRAEFEVLRPLFQWLSLSNSCINPILYAYFSRRFRRAFQEILVLPCTKRYEQFKSYTSNTSRRWVNSVRESRTFDFSGMNIRGGSSKRPSTAFSVFRGSGKRSSAWSVFSKRPSAAPSISPSLPEDHTTIYTTISDQEDTFQHSPSARPRRTSSAKVFGAGRRRSTGFRRRELHPDDAFGSCSQKVRKRRRSSAMSRCEQETAMTEEPATVRPASSSASSDYGITIHEPDITGSPLRFRVPSQRRADENRRAKAKLSRNGSAPVSEIRSVYV